MRLFLTATSERGKPVTKSGNEFIFLRIAGENRKEQIFLEIYSDTKGNAQLRIAAAEPYAIREVINDVSEIQRKSKK